MTRDQEGDDGLPAQAGTIRRPDNAYGDGVEWHTGFKFKQIWALTAAAAEGDATTIRTLAEAHPELIPSHYRDAMPFAVRADHAEAVTVMIEHGAFRTGHVEMQVFDQMIADAELRGHTDLAGRLDAYRRAHYHYRPGANAVGDAIKDRELDRVTALLDADTDLVRAADDWGNTPMHWAALTGQIDLVDLLLARGADINVVRCDGARPVDLTRGDYDYRLGRDGSSEAPKNIGMVTGYLIARGADYDIVVAADSGDLGRVRTLLTEDPSRASYLPPYHNWYTGSPLKCAANKGHIDIVKLLLEHGADPNMPEAPIAPHGIAVYDAAAHGHLEIVKLLLEHGANPDAAVDSCGRPLDAAEVGGHDEIADLLRAHGADDGTVDPLSAAAHGGDATAVRRLIGEDPALAEHAYLDYLIRCAAERDDRDVLQAFIDTVPDLFKRITVTRGTAETARWLLKSGMQSDLPNWLSWTPLHEVAARNDVALAEVFTEDGADLNPIDAVDASTPLGIAARDGRAEMATWLLKHGADPEGAGEAWARPLAWAERKGNDRIVELLRRHGAK